MLQANPNAPAQDTKINWAESYIHSTAAKTDSSSPINGMPVHPPPPESEWPTLSNPPMARQGLLTQHGVIDHTMQGRVVDTVLSVRSCPFFIRHRDGAPNGRAVNNKKPFSILTTSSSAGQLAFSLQPLRNRFRGSQSFVWRLESTTTMQCAPWHT